MSPVSLSIETIHQVFNDFLYAAVFNEEKFKFDNIIVRIQGAVLTNSELLFTHYDVLFMLNQNGMQIWIYRKLKDEKVEIYKHN